MIPRVVVPGEGGAEVSDGYGAGVGDRLGRAPREGDGLGRAPASGLGRPGGAGRGSGMLPGR